MLVETKSPVRRALTVAVLIVLLLIGIVALFLELLAKYESQQCTLGPAGPVGGVPANLAPTYQGAAAKYGLGPMGPAVLAGINYAAKLEVSLARLELGAFASPGIDPGELCRLGVRAPRAIAELAAIDRILYRTAEPLEDEEDRVLPRLNDNDMAALAALDKLGFMTIEQLRRMIWPSTTLDNVHKTVRKLASAGLVHRFPVQLEDQRGGRSTYLYALSSKGLYTGQHPPSGRRPSIDERRQHKLSQATAGSDLQHDLMVASWLISFRRAFGTVTSENWRTPRYAAGHLDVPSAPAPAGRRGERRQLSMFDAERALHEYYCFADTHAPQKVTPDLTVELRIARHDERGAGDDGRQVTTDLLVEIDNTGRPDYNAGKLRAYDSLLCGWCLLLPRYQRLQTRPFCLFVCPDINAMDRLMRRADREMTGAVGIKGTSDPGRWYYAGRDHIAFTAMELIHYGLPTAWMPPTYPPKVREQLEDASGYRVTPVSLLDPRLIAKEAMVGWELRGGRAVPAKPEGSR